MLLTEESLIRAVERFLAEAKIPRPLSWSPTMDNAFINDAIVPAFLSALKEIESVDFCTDFDMGRVKLQTRMMT